jgi:hypothetical protein
MAKTLGSPILPIKERRYREGILVKKNGSRYGKEKRNSHNPLKKLNLLLIHTNLILIQGPSSVN